MTRVRVTRIFWIGAAATLVAAALIALLAVVRGELTDTDGRILLSLTAVLYTGSAAIAGLSLADRGPARPVGWIVTGVAAVCLVLAVVAIWSFVWESDDDDPARAAWSAVLCVAAGLIVSIALLLAGRTRLLRLAIAAAGLATLAAVLSVAAIWIEEWDPLVKLLAACWILAGLAFLLIPILLRFSTAGHETGVERLVASLDNVDLIAIAGRPSPGDVRVDARRSSGETLVLRRHA